MILMIDNYDSFTYNIVQYLREMSADLLVIRNDAKTVDEVEAMQPQAVILSPGPGNPDEAGISLELVRRMSGKLPILGVCLGHQTIGQVFGGKVVRAKRLMHGKVSEVTGDGRGLFLGIERPFKAMRYHSLAIERASLPKDLVVTATSEDGEIMGVRHVKHPTEGIQFHPESIMTPLGKKMLRNFLNSIA
ncbi:MAG TPA: aminodeoxychorismate/anthranilate synthase component II [Fibrobacteraceae bacterium]|nr:aminodeoxychorismate/anthranilate synthase component II [Fibrobacteraceae bacterium]